MNLRNDVAHGTVRPEALSPGRVLLIWLFMIRLSFLRPIAEDEVEVEDEDEDEDEPSPDEVSEESDESAEGSSVPSEQTAT